MAAALAVLQPAEAVAGPPAAAPQGFTSSHRRAMAANPRDLCLTLGIRGGRSSFYQGEVIPLQITFASRSPHRYFIDEALYDRSGRLGYEEFHLDPDTGAEDPLWQYFADQWGAFSGGLREMGELGEGRPVSIPLDLNEWVRFDLPGRYRLYVVSQRIQHLSKARPNWGEGPSVPLASNVIEITVTADAAWAAAALAAAVRSLDTGRGTAARSRPTPDTHRKACRALRFLGTTAAVHEMVRRRSDDDAGCAGEITLGLFGLREWRVAVADMEERLDAADETVDLSFLEELSDLAAGQDGGPRRPRGVFGRNPIGQLPRPLWRAREARRQEALVRYAQRLLTALPRKHGRARGASAMALLGLTRSSRGCTGQGSAIDPRLAGLLRGQVAAAFAELSPREQERMLTWRWGELRDPVMAPALLRLYEAALAQPSPPWLGGENLATLALRRLFELQPEQATELLRAEAGRAVPRVGRSALGLLPPAAIEPLEPIIVDHLTATPPGPGGADALSFLLARYAGTAVLPRVRTFYERNLDRGLCLDAPFIAYFLRTDPPFGAEELRRVLDVPPREGRPECASTVLGEVGRLRWSPEVEAIAVAHLDAADPAVATDAAKVLGVLGSAAAEAPLWRRIERWSHRWSGREASLDRQESWAEGRLGEALVEAIVMAPAWLTDGQKLGRLEALLHGLDAGTNLHNRVAAREHNGKIQLSAHLDQDGRPQLTVAQYSNLSPAAATAKIEQFPRGTVFAWFNDCSFGGSPEEAALIADLRQFLQARGMTITR